MNRRVRFFFSGFLLISLLWLTACQQQSDHQHHQNTDKTDKPQSTASLSIEFQAKPTPVEIGQPIQLSTTVKRGNQPATDATVKLEVWEKNSKDPHQMLETKQVEKGTYATSQTFKQAGEYLVVVHATAPQVHQMISGKFQVGKETEGHSHQGHVHDQAINLHVMLPQQAKKGQATSLVGHVQKEGKPLTQARVRFEIWQEGKEQRQYVDTKENQPGEYTASYTFPETGTYHIKLHVEKESEHLHEHKEEKLTVQ
ncbi:FixH family protein [Thermoflavimicrobium dichotomicum]|uniref:YtkA-like n=1 Tax=Thermoflavimicrobium dichotomicum TaxID=46223 RepID=A0A1I3QRI7_9BACL|nr:FixH family protein [Thermoflavimicrobium dichotomicum]SFJ36863.1 YtkA-like [Thermoflavimicrobium dichotomicum]